MARFYPLFSSCQIFFIKKWFFHIKPIMVGLVGIEPTTNRLWADCSNPWATGPSFSSYNLVLRLVSLKGGKPPLISDKRQELKMAERMGFEPTGPKGSTPLAGEPNQPLWHLSKNNNGGEIGIRTLGATSDTTVFKTAAFDHSAISPQKSF